MGDTDIVFFELPVLQGSEVDWCELIKETSTKPVFIALQLSSSTSLAPRSSLIPIGDAIEQWLEQKKAHESLKNSNLHTPAHIAIQPESEKFQENIKCLASFLKQEQLYPRHHWMSVRQDSRVHDRHESRICNEAETVGKLVAAHKDACKEHRTKPNTWGVSIKLHVFGYRFGQSLALRPDNWPWCGWERNIEPPKQRYNSSEPIRTINVMELASIAIVGENGCGKSTVASKMLHSFSRNRCFRTILCDPRQIVRGPVKDARGQTAVGLLLKKLSHEFHKKLGGDCTLNRMKPLWHMAFPRLSLIPWMDEERAGIQVKRKKSLKCDHVCQLFDAEKMSAGELAIFTFLSELYKQGPINLELEVKMVLHKNDFSSASALVLVDEPETHLHHLLVTTFWRAVEREFPEHFFVYFTHDLLFASPHSNPFRQCLVLDQVCLDCHSFCVGSCTMHSEISEINDKEESEERIRKCGCPVLQEEWNPPPFFRQNGVDVYFSLVGEEMFSTEFANRVLGQHQRNVVFVEGSRTCGLDGRIYSLLFGDCCSVVPCSNCEEVRKSTAAYRRNVHLRQGEKASFNPSTGTPVVALGLLDRDFGEHDNDQQDGIVVSKLCIVENLYMIPELLNELYEEEEVKKIISDCLALVDKDRTQMQEKSFRNVRKIEAKDRFVLAEAYSDCRKFMHMLEVWKTRPPSSKKEGKNVSDQYIWFEKNLRDSNWWHNHTNKVLQALLSKDSKSLRERIIKTYFPQMESVKQPLEVSDGEDQLKYLQKELKKSKEELEKAKRKNDELEEQLKKQANIHAKRTKE